MSPPSWRLVTLFLCGDVMLGRGVDQILPHPGDPRLREDYVRDAREYVGLAQAASGPVPDPIGFRWPWGDALPVLGEVAPDVRVVNPETAVTRSSDFEPGKAVHYRMSPENLPSLAAGEPDVCALANNHVLDFGTRGLEETLTEMSGAGLRAAGAGLDAARAQRPAIIDVPGRARIVLRSPRNRIQRHSEDLGRGARQTGSRPAAGTDDQERGRGRAQHRFGETGR